MSSSEVEAVIICCKTGTFVDEEGLEIKHRL